MKEEEIKEIKFNNKLLDTIKWKYSGTLFNETGVSKRELELIHSIQEDLEKIEENEKKLIDEMKEIKKKLKKIKE